MYDIGKERFDGKVNVWKATLQYGWVIVEVLSSSEEAQNYIIKINRRRLK